MHLEKQKLAAAIKQQQIPQNQIQFELRQAELEVTEKLLALSNPNSIVSGASSKPPCFKTTFPSPKTQNHTHTYNSPVENTTFGPSHQGHAAGTKQHESYPQYRAATFQDTEPNGSPHSSGSCHANLQEYHVLLEEAREIRYSGRNLPFIFFQNQIVELIKRCPISHRKMDLLRASCQQSAREAISALVPPVPGWSMDTQIQRALEGLRLRCGCCSFLSEPLVKEVRTGPKISRIDSKTLEKLISELNDCELYARAHKQTHSLDSNFIIDVGERLPFHFKKQYTYFLQDNYGSTEQPSFDSFKQFLNRELHVVKTTFAERFLCSSFEQGNRSRPLQKVKIHQANIQNQKETSIQTTPLTTCTQRKPHVADEANKQNQSPKCFICSSERVEKRHFLYNCDNYLSLTPEEKQNAILRAKRCINCLQNHDVQDCRFPCKCKFCKQDTYIHTQTHYFTA